MNGKRILSVAELTRRIKFVLEDGFDDVWVEGELSNLVISGRGHAYFSLKDADSLVRCVLFRGAGSGAISVLEDGRHIVVNGRVSVYRPRGQYQLVVQEVELKGEGTLALAFEKLKRKLAAEGLFDQERKRPLPAFPRHVAVVTSASGAAIRDILKVSMRRNEGVRISVLPVLVQGDTAAAEIAKALAEVNEYDRLVRSGEIDDLPVDVIITGRGGGSLEDLWAFNEEPLARAIYASRIPVVSAVGHEIDITIADLVADHRAATPSAAAETVIPLKSELLDSVLSSRRRLALALDRRISAAQERLDSVTGRYVMRAPMNFLLQLEQRMDELARRAVRAMAYELNRQEAAFNMRKSKLEALDPMGVLGRGYSITFRGDKVVSSVGELAKGALIRTRLRDGEAESVVAKTKE